MSNTGSVRYIFPGGNTSSGFYSFYEEIADPTFKRLFILKGGPGVGKSTLIKNVGNRLIEGGYDIEYHCCSSDKDSYDGLVVPALKIAILDGTAPHTIDPKYPGAFDEIINLGSFWSEQGLVLLKEEIIYLATETKHLFTRAYNYLAQAKLLNEDQESYYQISQCLNIPKLNFTANKLIKEIFTANIILKRSKSRHLFASAITPQGLVNHLPSLFDNLGKKYIITGPAGSGKSTIVNKLYSAAIDLGYDVEAFHCSLIPDRLEHLILPELNIGIISSYDPHTYQHQPSDQIIDLKQLIDQKALKPYLDDISEASHRFDEALQRGLEFMARVKSHRDKLESHYIANMNFEALNNCREALISKILTLPNQG